MPRDEQSITTVTEAMSPVREAMYVKGPGAPRAGADLRTARERLNWNLDDVAAMLRIRPSYLEALEAGQLSQLPGNVYALGFLRTYAISLGLESEEMIRRFKAEAAEVNEHTTLVFPAPVPERGLPAGAWVLLGLLLVGAAYAGWYHLSGEGKLPAETVKPVPTRLAALVDQAVPGPDGRVQLPAPPPVPAAAPRAADDGGFEPRQAATENPLLAPEPAPAAPPAVEAMEAIPVQGGTPTTAIAMTVIHHPEAPPVAPVTADPPAPDGGRVLLRFTGDTWVQVRERGGQVLTSKVMKAGETFPVPDRPNLILSTGNAGRVEIVVDGAVLQALGGNGAVRKDVALDPDQLKAIPVSTGH